MRLGEKRYGWPTILTLATNDNKKRRMATFVRTLISCSIVDMSERTEDWKEDDTVAASSSSALATLHYCSQPAVTAGNKQLRKQKSVKVKIINYSINTQRGPIPQPAQTPVAKLYTDFLFNFFFSITLA